MQIPPEDNRWLDLIAVHPSATIFHHPAWIGLLAECYGFPSVIVGVHGDDGRLAAGLPVMEVAGILREKRLVALPFSDHCAPLAGDGAALAALIGVLDRYRRERGMPLEIRWKLLENVLLENLIEQGNGVAQNGEEFYLHSTPLSADPDEMFARLHRTRVQQPIRTAMRDGLSIRRGETLDDLRTFYRMHLLTRARLGTPVQPFRFFRLLWERMIRQELGFILLAELEGRPLAGALFLHWNQVLTYKFGASDPADRGHAPNHALLWEAMRWGGTHGFTSFDWGRTEPRHEGLREFKRGWGAHEEPAANTILADAPIGTGRTAMGRKFMTGLIRRSPPWVCRAIGELFYGQFA